MRHAKSSWKNAQLSDHQRPLNDRGVRSADDLGAQFAAQGYHPDIVFSSDSTRTTETWHGMWPHLEGSEISFRRDFYLGGLPDIQAAVSSASPALQTILVLGHNPGFSMAAAWLCGAHIELKTAYAAVLEQESSDWSGVHEAHGWTLANILMPGTR